MINETLNAIASRFMIASLRLRVAYVLGGSLAYLGLCFTLCASTIALARYMQGLPIHW